MGKSAKSDEPSRPPSVRGPLLVLVTVILCLPVVREVLAGQLPGTSAALRTGLAVLVAWTAVAGIGNLVDGYRRHNSTRPAPRPAPEDPGAPGT